MEIFPAIDILGGQVVRVSRTDPAAVVVYDTDPIAVADRFVAAGARWIHLVDLDRTFGSGDQRAMVLDIVKRLPIPVQLGGGLWRADDVMEMRDFGVQRVILGTRALADTAELRALADCFSDDCLAVAIEERGGVAWSRDWLEARQQAGVDLARRARDAGIRIVVHTDIAREGELRGANTAAARAIAAGAGVDVIVSGGVESLEGLAALRDAGLAGACVGRALFENRFTLQEALACCTS